MESIPVRNRKRAIGFYSALLGIDLEHELSTSLRFEEREDADPAQLCLNVASMEEALAIVWSHGGRVIDPERSVDGCSRYALVMDTEGNRLALFTLESATGGQKINFTPIEGSSGSVSSSSSW